MLSIIIGFVFAIIVGSGMSIEMDSKVMHHQVVITGFKFVPEELKVSLGDTVTWINKDIVPHNVINSNNPKEAVSTDLLSGEKYTFVVRDSLRYECGFHPSMKGKLLIP
jgi:plastocyanin